MSTTALALPKGTPPSVAERLAGAMNTVARMRERAKEQTENVMRTALAFGTGGALGYAEGRYDKKEIMNMPIPGAVGVAAKVVGFVAGSGPEAGYAHAVGDAAIAVQGYCSAKEIGVEKKQKASQTSSGYVNTPFAR